MQNRLPALSPGLAETYAAATDRLVAHVHDQLTNNVRITELIGHNSFRLMRDSHQSHAALMVTLFRSNAFELLMRTIPWVYRSYHARGFAYDYFPVELAAWQIAIQECLDNQVLKAEILTVYEWMIQHHDEMVKCSISGEGLFFCSAGVQ
ncbi:MAG: hypothetical protein WCP20_18620 [Desulfuromonadales bacterium]